MFGFEPFADIENRLPGKPRILPIPVNEHAQEILEHVAEAHVLARKHLRETAETQNASTIVNLVMMARVDVCGALYLVNE